VIHRSVIPSTMKPFRIAVDVGGLGRHLNLAPTNKRRKFLVQS
jgi:hypothetical protein